MSLSKLLTHNLEWVVLEFYINSFIKANTLRRIRMEMMIHVNMLWGKWWTYWKEYCSMKVKKKWSDFAWRFFGRSSFHYTIILQFWYQLEGLQHRWNFWFVYWGGRGVPVSVSTGISINLSLRFEVLTAVKMSILVFWVVTPCGLVGR
jgi:hypothetical protein